MSTDDEINYYIDKRVQELTAIRDTLDKDGRHYYAVSAGIFELLLLQQTVTKNFH